MLIEITAKTSGRCRFFAIGIAHGTSVGKIARIKFWINCFEGTGVVADAFDVTAVGIGRGYSGGSAFKSTCSYSSNISAVA